MTFDFEFSKVLSNIIDKPERKDRNLAISLNKKIKQIIACDNVSIQHFKNLKHDLSNFKRVQIGSFVLVFRLKNNVIIFEDFDHHDMIYKKRFII